MTSPAHRWALLDGRLVPHEGATVHANDLGLRRGFAVFETFRIEAGVPLFVEAHLARLARSAAALGLPLPRGVEGVAADVAALVAADALDVAALHVLLTGGPSDDGFTFRAPTCIVTSTPAPPRPTAPAGAVLVTHRHTRELPEAKSTNYLTFMRLAAAVRAAGAIDVVYHDGAEVAEGARSALGVVLGDTFVTRREGVLESVTMSILFAAARERMRVEERAITPDELGAADEVLNAGSVRGVVPIVAIDGRPVGDGAVGPHARALFAAFGERVARYVAERRVGATPTST